MSSETSTSTALAETNQQPGFGGEITAAAIGAEPGVVTTGGSLDETPEDARIMAELDARTKEMEAASVA